MLIVLANWLFILFISGAWGLAAYRLLRRYTDSAAPEAGLTTIVLIGLASLTTLCNLITLWLPISQAVCLFFIAGALVLFYLNRHAWSEFLKKQRGLFAGRNFRLMVVYFLLLLAIALLKTIGPPAIDDEAGYHLPLIRWIENYPVVPGIANIEDRMGFNPAIYMANALFGVAWLYKGGLYDLNSFLFVLIGGAFLSGFVQLLRGAKEHLLSGIIQAAALVFLFRSYLTSMDADFFNLYGVLYFLVCIVRQIEQKRLGFSDWQTVWYLLFFCFLVINKFSAALMAPVALWLVYQLLQKKQFRPLLIALAFGSVLFLSWTARNYYISGFSVYPIYFVDFFDVDWKVPSELAQGVYNYVSEYAKTENTRFFNEYEATQPALETWLPTWFQLTWAQLIGKVFFVGMAFSVFLWVRQIFIKEKSHQHQFRWLAFLIFIAIAGWFWKFPALRFGWPWVLVFMCVTLFISFEAFIKRNRRWVEYSFAVLLAISLFRSTISTVYEALDAPSKWIGNIESPLLRQKIQGFELHKHWIYPVSTHYEARYSTQYFNQIKVLVAPDNFCRDAMPPCLPKNYLPGLEARGNRVEEGFRIAGKQ